MNAILSIKPQFVEEIILGRKLFEFRKKGFKKEVQKIYIYASSPVCRIVGEFVLGCVVQGKPDDVWSRTSEKAGISKEYFNEYYGNRDTAIALEITSFVRYNKPINPYASLEKFTPPQSFCYVNGSLC